MKQIEISKIENRQHLDQYSAWVFPRYHVLESAFNFIQRLICRWGYINLHDRQKQKWFIGHYWNQVNDISVKMDY